MTITEFRGCSDLVAAEILKDDLSEFTADTPFVLAGLGEISKTTETSSAAKYYDNVAAIVINSEGADTITLNISSLSLENLAKLQGKTIDSTTGAFIDCEGESKYFALGYKLTKTDGTIRYVWRLKGSFGIPDENSKTKDNSTDSQGQVLTYTGISTTHKFTKTGKTAKPAKAVVVDDTPESKCDVSSFFDQVTTPDNLLAKGG